jgi:hypothetical protein
MGMAPENVVSFDEARRRRLGAANPNSPYHGEVLHFVQHGACVRCHAPVRQIPMADLWTDDTFTYEHAVQIGCRLCSGAERGRK